MPNAVINLWNEWKKLANRFYLFQAKLILTIFYYTIIIPSGMLFKILRTGETATGWVQKDQSVISDIESLKNQ